MIVPAYQAAATIGLCLDALNAQTMPRESYEVIVVDDGSTDGTGEIARQAGAQVITQRNTGAAAARNAGAAVACGELLLFTDADCAPLPGWITALVAPFADERVSGVKGAYLTCQQALLSRFTQLEYEDRYDRMAGVETIDFVDTYSAAYRRDIFLANGGFDPAFRFDEDQELSFRLTEKGYRLVFAPAAQVYHSHNVTLLAYVRRKFLMAHWKVPVTRRHPSRMVKDSHTPQALKLQMGLAAAAAIAFPAAALASLAGWGVSALAVMVGMLTVLIFGLSEIPFLVKVWRRDRGVTLPAVGLLWVRAFALGAGFALGLVRFRGRVAASRPPIAGYQRVVKRLIDVVLGGLTLAIMALPMVGIALAVRLDSPGPIFFRQKRVGQDGRPFRIFKFRTMVDHAEEMLPQLVDLAALAQPAFKLHGDPRVTRTGRVLRRWSLDEVPQLFNVLRGEMSLVGPRPEQADVVARLHRRSAVPTGGQARHDRPHAGKRPRRSAL